MSDERHRALKRWERGRQLDAVRSDPELTGPPALCRVLLSDGSEGERVPVHIIALFAKDLACVRSYRETSSAGPGGYWLVRGGIRWEEYLRAVVRHYSAGLPVPQPFRAVRKIGPAILSQLEKLPDAALPPVFAKLRESGLLPTLPALSRETCPSALPWDDVRARFQDFQGSEGAPAPQG